MKKGAAAASLAYSLKAKIQYLVFVGILMGCGGPILLERFNMREIGEQRLINILPSARSFYGDRSLLEFRGEFVISTSIQSFQGGQNFPRGLGLLEFDFDNDSEVYVDGRKKTSQSQWAVPGRRIVQIRKSNFLPQMVEVEVKPHHKTLVSARVVLY